MKNLILKLCAVCLALIISGCANLGPKDKPLSHWTSDANQKVKERFAGNRSKELLVLMAFSGGGTRAASFSYGTLKELAAIKVTTENGEKSLLHEVDVISSVSGGSFTSAYYGLRGDQIFEDFEDRFLRKNVEGTLIGKVLNPFNWIPLMSSSYGKSDLAAGYYDKILFDNATFSDFNKLGAPVVVINSTDLGTGIRIPFTHHVFGILCADFDQYPVSRAVTASSAVPVVFSPITLQNFAGSCGYEPPAWMKDAINDGQTSYRKLEAIGLEEYFDGKKRPWLHLVDGGISDNLGLRTYYNTVSLIGDPHLAFSELNHPDVRQVLVILVNSHTKPKADWAMKKKSPSIPQVIGSMSSAQISRYSIDTLYVVRKAFKNWAKEASTPERLVTMNFVDVSFDQVKDEAERQLLNDIGTSFHLKDEEVDLLISAAGKVLRESPEFQAFLQRNRDSVHE